ncbi:MAG: PAS domain-containing protein [Candidatus Thorarchaeota archaeon]
MTKDMKMGSLLAVFEALFESIKVGVVVVDNENRIILFNRRAGEMLQVDPKERIGSSILRCHGEASEAAVLKMIDDLRSGRISQSESWVNYRGRILYEYIYPLRDSAGNCIGIVDELHDAAERAEYLKSRGEWKEIHVSGVGSKAPRSPFP